MARPQHSPRRQLRVPSHVNDNHCVNSVTGQKNSLCVTGQTGLNPPSVVAGDKKVTKFECRLALQMLILSKERHKSQLLSNVHRNKICARCFLFIFLFIYLGFYVAFNTVQVISQRVVGRAEETSTYSSLGFCTVNCRPTASNYQLSH